MTGVGLTFDLSRCYGCDACAAACRDEHLLPFDTAWIAVEKTAAADPDDGNRVFTHRMCLHCAAPDCLAACPEGALFPDEGGVVQVDDEACTGCGVCVTACPHGALTVSDAARVVQNSPLLSPSQQRQRARWRCRAERKVPTKCDLCLERRRAGRVPACVAICPVQAIAFDDPSPGETVRVRFLPPG